MAKRSSQKVGKASSKPTPNPVTTQTNQPMEDQIEANNPPTGTPTEGQTPSASTPPPADPARTVQPTGVSELEQAAAANAPNAPDPNVPPASQSGNLQTASTDNLPAAPDNLSLETDFQLDEEPKEALGQLVPFAKRVKIGQQEVDGFLVIGLAVPQKGGVLLTQVLMRDDVVKQRQTKMVPGRLFTLKRDGQVSGYVIRR